MAAPRLEVIFQGECRLRKEVAENKFWGALVHLKVRKKKEFFLEW